jgi:hypothetical protein
MKVFPNHQPDLCSNKKKYFGSSYSSIDITGRQVYSSENEDFNGEKSIDLSDLNKGIYILKIKGDSLNFCRKIILIYGYKKSVYLKLNRFFFIA